MRTKLYLLLVLTAGAAQVFAQCGQRYKDMIFSQVTKTSNVTYSTSNNTTLKMDIYEPTGDTATQRPVLIMAHGGSFIGGDKGTDGVCTQICTNYAKRGYVTADIQYRLGNPLAMLDSTQAITTVLKAISDGKSAVRFFRKDAATTNTYKIDPNWVFVGGNSAGAVLYMHVIYLDSTNEAPTAMRNLINSNGGFEGNSGNPGYPSDVQGVLNLAGGLNVPEFVGPGSRPSFNAQGDQDNTVPYGCANAQGGATPVRLCGLLAIEPLYNQYNVNHVSIVYPGEGHVPWQSNQAEMAEIDTNSANFFYSLMCSSSTSINDVKFEANVMLFPNPASSVLNLHTSVQPSSVTLLDNVGRTVITQNNIESNNVQLNTTGLAKGIYFVRIEFTDGNYAIATRKVVIE